MCYPSANIKLLTNGLKDFFIREDDYDTEHGHKTILYLLWESLNW